MTSQEALPEILVTRCLDVLRTLSSSERDLFMLVVEIVHELQDSVKIGEDPVCVTYLTNVPNDLLPLLSTLHLS